MDRSHYTSSFGVKLNQQEERGKRRIKTAIHAFASDIDNKYGVKCVIREVSGGGCKIVTNCMDDLPDIIHVIPEGFESPILGKIVWRDKNIAGVQFLMDMDDESLLLNQIRGNRNDRMSSVIDGASLRSRPGNFKDRFRLFSFWRNRHIHESSKQKREEVDNTVGDYISMIVHEFRTPLTSLLGSLGLIKSGIGGALQERGTSLVNVAHKNAQKLNLMVNDLLDLSKAESGQMQLDLKPVDMVALARETIKVNEPYAAKYDIQFRLHDRVGRAHVNADALRLEQVLTNLLSNAAKFSPAGKVVDVIVEWRDANVRVSVRDRGPGIPQKMQDQVFQKFVQINSPNGREKHGTGLGLSICKSILEKHGVGLQIDSKPGLGSTFFFELPKIEADSSEAQLLAAK